MPELTVEEIWLKPESHSILYLAIRLTLNSVLWENQLPRVLDRGLAHTKACFMTSARSFFWGGTNKFAGKTYQRETRSIASLLIPPGYIIQLAYSSIEGWSFVQ